MNLLSQNIPEIQEFYSNVTDLAVLEDLLAQEKKGKKRKVLKRWLKERIKLLESPHSLAEGSIQASPSPSDEPIFKMFDKPPKDKITGIPNIG